MKAVDLFSGFGGLSLGLEKAGIEEVAGYENWEPAINIYEQNFNHPINSFDLNEVIGAANHISRFHPDMIVGGPPARAFRAQAKEMSRGAGEI